MVAFVLVLASVPLTGGKLGRLGQLRVRWIPAILATIVVQTVLISGLPDMFSSPVMAALHLATYLPAVAFVWVNRHIPGLWLLGLGGVMNLAAIAGNGGVMPALPSASAAAGQHLTGSFINSAPSTGSPLWFLGDVFVWPEPLPLANVFSAGDVLLLVGAAIVLHTACRREAAPGRGTWSWTYEGEQSVTPELPHN